jgi:hypothetical protein
MHAVAFIPMLYVPTAHAPHVLSLAALPSDFTDCPAGQSVHFVHAAALYVPLKVPASQALQTRFATAVPLVVS